MTLRAEIGAWRPPASPETENQPRGTNSSRSLQGEHGPAHTVMAAAGPGPGEVFYISPRKSNIPTFKMGITRIPTTKAVVRTREEVENSLIRPWLAPSKC